MKGDGEEEKQEGTANLVDAKETSVDTSVAVVFIRPRWCLEE